MMHVIGPYLDYPPPGKTKPMASFRIVTDHADGTETTINLDLVREMLRVDDYTVVKFAPDHQIDVYETPSEILSCRTKRFDKPE